MPPLQDKAHRYSMNKYAPMGTLLQYQNGVNDYTAGHEDCQKKWVGNNKPIVDKFALFEILSTDDEIDKMYPIINSSGIRLDGNACRQEVLKEYNKMLIERSVSNI